MDPLTTYVRQENWKRHRTDDKDNGDDKHH